MTDRRHFIRWQISRQTNLKLEGAENFTSCTVNDISLAGFKVSLALRLPKNTFLKLSLVLSEDLCLDIEAWVVWHKTVDGHNSYGIYFSRIKDGDKEKIYQFIRQNFPKQLNSQWWRGIRKKGGEIMEEKNFEDRRIFGRFTAKIPLRFLDLKENKEGEASVQDVSAKGIGFLANEELQPRTPVEMWLQIPDKGEPLYTRGEVVWSRRSEPSPNQFRVGVNLERADLMGLSRVLRVG